MWRPLAGGVTVESNYLAWLLVTAAVGALLVFVLYRTFARQATSESRMGSFVLIATLVLLFVGCAYGARLGQTADINCETADGEYDDGEFGWSTIPPGPTCTFTQAEHGFDEVRGPNLGMSIWLALVGAGTAAAAVIAIRDSRARTGELQAQR